MFPRTAVPNPWLPRDKIRTPSPGWVRRATTASDDRGDLVAGLADAARHVHLGEEPEADDEEEDEAKDRQPVGIGDLQGDA